MNPYVQLFFEALISVVASLSVLYALSPPLLNVLNRVCPDEQAASFWLSYTKVMLILAPLLLVLMVDMFSHFSNPIDALRFALVATLIGLLIGLHLIGKRLGQFVKVPQQPAGVA